MALDVGITRRRFTLDEYHRMADAEILHEDDRVELIRGEIVQMSLIGPPHAAAVAALNRLLVQRAADRAVVWPQNPIVILPDSEPQPDVVLLRPRGDGYRRGHPQPEDILLLVEIADTSLRYDRTVKLQLYAAAGVREVWIVDLGGGAIEVYREPEGERYRRQDRVARGGALAPEAFADLLVPVSEILG
jgi:Uma2 family endonuclease